jgi:3-hydroxy-9,10-secoandrosta-1,3,5(10)-triene-9,17-dione monooxygenase reductase component
VDTFDEARYRQVLGHFATGVTVVTAVAGGEPLGLAVNSFTSVSLEPPLVAVCIAARSSTWPRVRDVGAFCVNILSEDQEAVSRVFAARGPKRFSGIGYEPARSGSPILAGVLAWIDCTIEAEYPGGDHFIVVGRVRDLGVSREHRPLVFYRGGYGRFEP